MHAQQQSGLLYCRFTWLKDYCAEHQSIPYIRTECVLLHLRLHSDVDNLTCTFFIDE